MFAGPLGNGKYDRQPFPFRVSSNLAFTQVACGFSHTCAVATDGSAWCFGESLAALPPACSAPECVGHGLCFACGRAMCDCASPFHSCAGQNSNGQLGDNTTTYALVPVAVLSSQAFSEVACSSSCTCGRGTDGMAFCWGGCDSGLPLQCEQSSLLP